MPIDDQTICPECKSTNTRYLKRVVSPNGCFIVDRFVCRECGLIYTISGETGKVIVSEHQPLQEDWAKEINRAINRMNNREIEPVPTEKDDGISMILRKDLS